nr:MAG TPA: hypothetical protein [Crassvirales sp.]
MRPAGKTAPSKSINNTKISIKIKLNLFQIFKNKNLN